MKHKRQQFECLVYTAFTFISLCILWNYLCTRDSTTRSQLGSHEILAFVDKKSISVAETWYEDLSRLGYVEHSLVATDRIAFDYFDSVQYRVTFEPGHHGIAVLLALKERVDSGKNILLLDCDFVFTSYVPLIRLFQTGGHVAVLEENDINSSSSHATQQISTPVALSWWTASPYVSSFLGKLTSICEQESRCEYLREVNELLVEEKFLWYPTHLSSVRHYGVSSQTGMLLAVLNHESFPLTCVPKSPRCMKS